MMHLQQVKGHWTMTFKAIVTSSWSHNRTNKTANPIVTFSFTIPERHGALVLGHEASATGEAQDPARFWLVGTHWTDLTRTEPICREVTCRTLT